MNELRGSKFVAMLVLVFKNIESDNKTKHAVFYSNSKAEIIINENDIDDVFWSVYTTIISNIQKFLGKGSGWIIDSVTDYTISILKYNPLAGSSYIKLNPPRKGLSNIQNIDNNECFKWCLVGYLHLMGHNKKKTHTHKHDKDFAKKLDF